MNRYAIQPDKVYFFGTCLADAAYPDAGLSGIRLLKRAGLKVIFPPDQSCCGQPAFNSGFPNEARAVAQKQAEVFSKNYPIVVPSGSCAGMLRHHYPALFAGRPGLEVVKHFSDRVYELTEFLARVLKFEPEDRGAPIKVTWHSSCHAAREMGVAEDCKAMIRKLKNVELVELENEHQCCGFGGTFSVKHPEISAAMVSDKVADIVKTGAERVLSADCGCLMNITGNMAYRNIPVRGQHLAEFLWERING